MAVTDLRIFLYFEDEDLQVEMTFFHFGVYRWFAKKLKQIKSELNGIEAKGVNIVNFVFMEDAGKVSGRDEWRKRMNAFEYTLEFDMNSMVKSSPLLNIERMINVMIPILLESPWSQTRAIGKLLSQPLTDSDRVAIQLCLDRHRISPLG